MNGTAHPFSLLPCRPAQYFPRTARPDGGGERESKRRVIFKVIAKLSQLSKLPSRKGEF